MAQVIKNLPAMQDPRVQSLGQEDPLEKGMAVHCSILAWRIPWTEEPGGLVSVESQSDTTERLTLSLPQMASHKRWSGAGETGSWETGSSWGLNLSRWRGVGPGP